MKTVPPKSYAQSARLYEEARKYAPGGVHSHFRRGSKSFPLFFARAQGSRLCDVDGNEYVDYALGMGPVILGHAHPAVNEAVEASLAKGQLYAGQHEEELALARLICELVPCAELVRLSLSGTEAVQAALRLARAATGRRRVIKFEGHYHGWLDNIYVSVHPDQTRMGAGSEPQAVPMSLGQDAEAYTEIQVLPWNNSELFSRAVEAQRGQIAAVIMEPIMCNTSVILPRPGFLERVREVCTQEGIILIFDEVITGFRVGLGGAQEYLGVKPDLAAFAKAMANGYPISCLAGRRDLMELLSSQPVVHAGTYNSNRISCAAALATLELLRRNNGEAYSRINRLGAALIKGLKGLAGETGQPLRVEGLPSVFHTTFAEHEEIFDYRSYLRCGLELQSRFVTRLLERGIRVTERGVWFLSLAHTEQDIDVTLDAARAALLSL